MESDWMEQTFFGPHRLRFEYARRRGADDWGCQHCGTANFARWRWAEGWWRCVAAWLCCEGGAGLTKQAAAPAAERVEAHRCTTACALQIHTSLTHSSLAPLPLPPPGAPPATSAAHSVALARSRCRRALRRSPPRASCGWQACRPAQTRRRCASCLCRMRQVGLGRGQGGQGGSRQAWCMPGRLPAAACIPAKACKAKRSCAASPAPRLSSDRSLLSSLPVCLPACLPAIGVAACSA